jgi:tight adherence protein B
MRLGLRRLTLTSAAALALAATPVAVAATPTTTTQSATTTQSSTTSTTSSATSTTSNSTKPNHAKAKKPAQVPLSGWLGNGTRFPQRAIVLTQPSGPPLSASSVNITENGAAVTGATLTPVPQAQAGDYGLMVVIDQNHSMSGAPMTAAMNAVRQFAAARTPNQQLGVVVFDSTPNVFMPLTTDLKKIAAVLASTPWTGVGANVPAGTTLALNRLVQSKVALGAIVVISDGVGKLTFPGGPTPASVQTAAAAAHVPIFTVGLQDAASSASSLNALKAVSPGQFFPTPMSQIPHIVRAIDSTMAKGYVARYRSQQPAGKPVSVAVNATGVPGTVSLSYQAPAAPAPAPKPAASSSPAPKPRHTGPNFSGSTLLTPQPAFAPQQAPPAAASTSFWDSGTSVALIALICGLLLTLAVALLFYRPANRAVRVRVAGFIPPAEAPEDPAAAIELSPKRSMTPRLFERSTWWAPFERDVEIGRNPHTPTFLVKRGAAVGAVCALLAYLITSSPLLALAPLLLWPIPVRVLVSRGARKQRELFSDQLPGYLQDLASAMRVGRSFAGSLAVVAAGADEPVRSELERAVTDEALGRPIEESLEAVSVRMESADMDQIALIAALNRRSGSNVAEALDRVAEGARDRGDMRREVKALTAQGKMSSMVLTALPPLLLVGIALIAPRYAQPLLHTTVGLILLVVAGLMVFAGWKVMKKITTIKA